MICGASSRICAASRKRRVGRSSLGPPERPGSSATHRAPRRTDSRQSADSGAQPEASAGELLMETAVLLDQVLDHLLLAAIHPTGDDRNAELKDERVHGRQGSATGNSVGRPGASSMDPARLVSAEYWYSTRCGPAARCQHPCPSRRQVSAATPGVPVSVSRSDAVAILSSEMEGIPE